MALQYDFSFYLLILSALFSLVLTIIILRMKNKAQIHYVFVSFVALIFIWCTGHVFEVISTIQLGKPLMITIYIYYFGLIFMPISVFFTGLIFEKSRIKFTFPYLLLFIFPVVDYILLLTNDIHNQYFVHYSIFRETVVLGSLFPFHIIASYLFILIGFFLLIRYVIKNSGFFSRQSLLIIIGITFPFIINILLTFQVFNLPAYYTPITFTFTIICFALAIIKFDFLNITPIALQRIVDLISDSYIVVKSNFDIIDFNKTFVDSFPTVNGIVRKANLLRVIKENPSFNLDAKALAILSKKAIRSKQTVGFEANIVGSEVDRYFMVEITPIFVIESYLGTIILLKDITQSKKDLEVIVNSQTIIMEQERLSSLGQLIAGIAHNLRTPIMSLSGGIEKLKDLVHEYEQSIDDKSIGPEDHHEIAKEMDVWLEKMKPYCSYMSEIISTVKGLAVQNNVTGHDSFKLEELIKRMDLFMKHELDMYHCQLNISCEIGLNTQINGVVSSLLQVFDGIIINAIHSYNGETGMIDLTIKQEQENILFTFTDYGVGMKKDIQEKLFKQMVTTKGNKGTGLGLYMSYATIKGNFNGDIWFDSVEGKGTTIYISIPFSNLVLKEEGQ